MSNRIRQRLLRQQNIQQQQQRQRTRHIGAGLIDRVENEARWLLNQPAVKATVQRAAQLQQQFAQATAFADPLIDVANRAAILDDRLPSSRVAQGAAITAQRGANAAGLDPRLGAGLALLGTVLVGGAGGQKPKGRRTKVEAPKAIDLTAPRGTAPAQASFNKPIVENPVPLRIRHRLDQRRQQLGGLAGERNARLQPPAQPDVKALPKGEILEVRPRTAQPQQPQPRVNPAPVNTANGLSDLQRQAMRDTLSDLGVSPYQSQLAEGINPTVTARRRGKTGNTADQTRTRARQHADRRVDQFLERENVKLQDRYNANPEIGGKKQIQEADQKTVNQQARQLRQREQEKATSRIKDAVRRRNEQNVDAARFDINENLTKEQANRMAGPVRHPYPRATDANPLVPGSKPGLPHNLSKAEFDALPKETQRAIQRDTRRLLATDPAFKKGVYQEGRIDARQDVPPGARLPEQARGLYGFDDQTRLPNGYKNYGDDVLSNPPKIDGQARGAGDKTRFIDSSGRQRSERSFKDNAAVDTYRAGDFAQPRQTPKRIQERLSRRGNRASADQQQFYGSDNPTRDTKAIQEGALPTKRDIITDSSDPTVRSGFGYRQRGDAGQASPELERRLGRGPLRRSPADEGRQLNPLLPPGRVPDEGSLADGVVSPRKNTNDRIRSQVARRRGTQPIAQSADAKGQTIRQPERVFKNGQLQPESIKQPSDPLSGRKLIDGKKKTNDELLQSDLKANQTRIRDSVKKRKDPSEQMAKALNENTDFIKVELWDADSYRKYAETNGLPTDNIKQQVERLNNNLKRRYPELAHADTIFLPRKEGQADGLVLPYNGSNQGKAVRGADRPQNDALNPIRDVVPSARELSERYKDDLTHKRISPRTGLPVRRRKTSEPETDYLRERIRERLGVAGRPGIDYREVRPSLKQSPTIDGVDNRRGVQRSIRTRTPDGERHLTGPGRRGIYDENGKLVGTRATESNQGMVSQSAFDTALRGKGKARPQGTDEEIIARLIDRVVKEQLPALDPNLKAELKRRFLAHQGDVKLQRNDPAALNTLRSEVNHSLNEALKDLGLYPQRNNAAQTGIVQKDFQNTGDLRGVRVRGSNLSNTDGSTGSEVEKARRLRRRAQNRR